MKNLFLVLVLSLISILTFAGEKNDKRIYGKELFPLSETKQYIYESSFGETKTKSFLKDGSILTSSEASNFKYRQKLELNDNGLFVNNTYQWIKLLLFIKKENSVSYNKPLLRYSLPLFVGKTWSDKAIEYIEDDSSSVNVNGRVISEEEVNTSAGTFNTLKIETIVESSSGSKNIVTEWIAENIGLVKANIEIKGGGITGFARDLLGYGTITFELKKIID